MGTKPATKPATKAKGKSATGRRRGAAKARAKQPTSKTRRDTKTTTPSKSSGACRPARATGQSARIPVFIREYLADPERNGAQAAIRAGYSERTARAQACRLLTRADVREAIEAHEARERQKAEDKAARVIEELERLAFLDTTRVVRIEHGRVVVEDTEDLPEEARRGISEISQTFNKDGLPQVRVKFHDKQSALHTLARHYGLLVDRTEHVHRVAHAADELTDEQLLAIASGQAPALGPPTYEGEGRG